MINNIKKIVIKIFYFLNSHKFIGRYFLIVLLNLRKTIRKYRLGNKLNEVDIILRYIDMLDLDTGILFDVGASTGSFLERFLKKKWLIYAFEPDPNPIKCNSLEYFQKKYELKYINKACSNKSGEVLPFFTSSKSTGISSLHAFDSTHSIKCEVLTITLTDFIIENNIDMVNILKIDTEGHDYFVLQGFPWSQQKPFVIMCEFEDKKTVPLGYDFHELGNYLLAQNYIVFVSEWYPVVEYGGNHQWRKIKEFPTELDDPNAFGNFICFSKDTYKKEFDSIMFNSIIK